MSEARHCTLFILVMALLRTVFADEDPAILNLYRQNFSGNGTYFMKSEGGACSYPPPSLPPVANRSEIKYLVALNAPQFMQSKACGMCLMVYANGEGTGENPIPDNIMVFVKDLYPRGEEGDIDIAENLTGRWKIQIRGIQCPVGDTKIEYKFQGSDRFYIKLQVRNVRFPTGLVRLKRDDGWTNMTRTKDGFWTSSGTFDFPIDVEITGANGEVLYDRVPRLANDEVIHGDGVQFALDDTISEPSTSSTAFPTPNKQSSVHSTPSGALEHNLYSVFVMLSKVAVLHALS